MNDKKFWKVIYLYVTKYGYDIIYYRPEKRDVWLINDDNELIRFVYSTKFSKTEIDSVVSNVIKSEATLKKMFKLNTLKIKIFYVAEQFADDIIDYKKHKISSSLIIERIVFNEKNRDSFIREQDSKFITATLDTDKYKERVIELYKKKQETAFNINFKFNVITLIYIVFFIANFMGLYFSKNKFSLYDYLDYNYQNIISGELYRLFTNVFVANDIKTILVIGVVTFICSIIFNEKLKLHQSLVILLSLSFFFNLFLIFGYYSTINIAIVCYFGILGGIFLSVLNGKANNLLFISSLAIPAVLLVVAYIVLKVDIVMAVLAFILGIFLQIFLVKRHHIFVILGYVALVILAGVIIVLTNFDTKTKINNYRLKSINKELEQTNKQVDIYKLEQELSSKNKSILSYYELGMIRITNSSVSDAKKIFVEGIKFDDSFAPIYYQLALIERQESNFAKSKEYAKRAYELENKDEYKNLLDELEKY